MDILRNSKKLQTGIALLFVFLMLEGIQSNYPEISGDIVPKEQDISINNISKLPPVNDDIYMLARLIHAEARGEPIAGQIAVGSVVLNRVESRAFSNSVEEVIFKSGEFCTVRDGQINLPPNPTAIRAARIAAAGWDPSGGALYFYNPTNTTSNWIYSREITTRIGSHVFAV